MFFRLSSFPLGCLLCVAGAVSLAAQDIRVTSSQLVLPNAGRVTWGAKNNLLAFDTVSAGGYYDIYTSNPDGSNSICLTCGAPQLPAYNKGNPEWDPTNQYLAIEVQWSTAFLQADAAPGVGVNNDLYIMDAAGKNYWPVTNQAAGILHPRFSPDGTKLLWVQRTGQAFSNYWNLMLGDFAVNNGVPQVTNIQSLPPCQNNVFCETGGFSTDGDTVFFTGNLDGQAETGIDIYSYNLQSGVLTNLTNSPANWDEFPTSFPNAQKLVWMSGVDLPAVGLETDYWMMDYDGSNKVQLTYFNDQTAPSWYLGSPISTAKFNWGPNGAQMASYFIPNGTGLAKTGSIYILGLEAAAPTVSAATYGRPPVAADSIAATFYSDLAAETQSAPSTPLPTSLAGTTVSVTDALGAVRSAPLFFVSPGQVNWEVPAGTAPGPATIQFTNAQNISVRDTVDVELISPGLFAANATGSGPASAYLLLYPSGAASPSSTQFVFACPAGGSCTATPVTLGAQTDAAYLILFGTGVRHSSGPVVVQIGDLTIPAASSGAQGVYAGLDQVNVLLPNSLAGSGLLNVNLVVDGVSSNTVQINIQ